MAALEERLKELEEEIRKTPYNKATQHHIGRLKAKIARLRKEGKKIVARSGKSETSVRKSGDASVVMVGYPSVGKSSLLNSLTNASSKVASYGFTTLKVIPGMMEHRGARIQLMDVPGLIEGASEGRGRGRKVLSVIRNADLVLLIIDVFNPQQFKDLKKELYKAGIRLDDEPPKVKIRPLSRGGLSISSTVELTHLDEATIRDVLGEFKIYNGEVVLREDITLERLIDAVAGNRVYLPSLVVLNKTDLVRDEYISEVKSSFDCIPVSAKLGTNLESLKDAIYSKLDFIRVFTKEPGGEPDLEEPLILIKNSCIADLCSRLHRDFRDSFRYARVWGPSVKHPGQRVGLSHVLTDRDIVTIVVRK
jgi:hypothetical protein